MKIAIYGPMCSGKTTVARIIQEIDERYEIYSFGTKINFWEALHEKFKKKS